MHPVRIASALLLAVAAAAMLCGPAAIVLVHKALPLAPDVLLARALPLAAMSLAALPLGAVGAAGLAEATPALRLGGCGLLTLAVLGFALGGTGPAAPYGPLAPLLASTAIVMLILTPRLARLDPVLLEVAAASGASPWDRLVLVVLPWIAGPCLAAFLLCLAIDAGVWLMAA